MKWILSFVLLICMQVRAEEAATVVAASNPPAELTVTPPSSESPAPESAPVSASVSAPAEEKASTLKETEIPVHLEAAKKTVVSENPMVKMLISFSIIGILGCAAFYLIRKYRFQNPNTQATQIKILSQHYLGPKKSLAIVRVAGESVLIGITDQNISMIKSLSLLDEDIPEESPKDFPSLFSKKTKLDSFEAEEPEKREDDFTFSGIKDFVSVKLKNMRSLE